MYSWWWVWKATETCRVTLQWNKIDCEHLCYVVRLSVHLCRKTRLTLHWFMWSFVLGGFPKPLSRKYKFVSDRKKTTGPLHDDDLFVLTCSLGGLWYQAAVQLQAWSGPERFRKWRSPDFMTPAQGGGKVVSLTRRPHLPPRNSSGSHFCLIPRLVQSNLRTVLWKGNVHFCIIIPYTPA